MVLFVVMAVFGSLKWLDIYTHHGEAVAVPDLTGRSINEARNLLERTGLQYVVSDSNYVKTLPAGSVLECNPPVGQKVKKNRIVYLTINSLNIPLVAVPDVADNSSLRQAEQKLIASGFKLGQEEYISGEKDWVYGVKYNGRQLNAGEKVPMESTLSLMVGYGGELPDSLSVDHIDADSNISETTTDKHRQKKEEDDGWFK